MNTSTPMASHESPLLLRVDNKLHARAINAGQLHIAINRVGQLPYTTHQGARWVLSHGDQELAAGSYTDIATYVAKTFND